QAARTEKVGQRVEQLRDRGSGGSRFAKVRERRLVSAIADRQMARRPQIERLGQLALHRAAATSSRSRRATWYLLVGLRALRMASSLRPSRIHGRGWARKTTRVAGGRQGAE